jgi:hypothetical protein
MVREPATRQPLPEMRKWSGHGCSREKRENTINKRVDYKIFSLTVIAICVLRAQSDTIESFRVRFR